jgi:cystathionine beta-lyase family protein involved in aluminum resistance
VAGRADLVAAAGRRLSAPGVAGGATLGQNRALFQGLFNAPAVVGEALKGASLVAHVMHELGYECNPPSGENRTDIIQAVKLGTREKVIAFCEAVQRCSPVGAHIKPVPGVTPGYGDEVIFADGTFIDGSTLELSADGPLREPFAVYLQGGTHWAHWALVLREVLTDERMAQASSSDESPNQVPQGGTVPPRRYAGRRTLRNT